MFKPITMVKNRDDTPESCGVSMGETMATMTKVGCGPLRALRWPDAPAVDLLSEFPWIVAGDGELWNGEPQGTANNMNGERRMKKPRNAPLLEVGDDSVDQGGPHPSVKMPSSPYKECFLPTKAARSPLSPAQRAAKKVLQLKTELQQIVASDVMLTSTTRFLSGDTLGWQHDTNPSHGSREGGVPQPRRSGKTASSSPSPPTSSSKMRAMSKQRRSRSPICKTRGQTKPPTPADEDLREKQERLTDWLKKNTSREREEGQIRNTVSYSVEVNARVHAAVTCKDDESDRNDALWVDPVRSLLAAEVTSETVLGGFIPTRRLAFEPSVKRSECVSTGKKSDVCVAGTDTSVTEASPTGKTSPTALATSHESSSAAPLIEVPTVDFAAERALDIQRLARQQLAAGDITDALATLDAGIHRILHEYQDNHEQLRHAGFSYSVAAHQFASKLQLQYRRRHRERVRNLVLLQRAWRRFRLSANSRSTNNYDDAHAATIQRPYKRRYRQIVQIRSASRIQKCFRVYQSQKHILHFHQACRLLLGRERHRRELERQVLLRKQRMWVKLKIVLRVLRLWKMRRYSITSLQKRWKGGKSRAQYVDMLNKLRDAESERRRREDAFVTERIEAIVDLYRGFLCNTRRGRTLVNRHAELSWLRFRRLRGKNSLGGWMELSTEERIDLLDRMYNGRQVGSWEWWVISRQLSLIDPEVRQLQRNNQLCCRVTISSSGLQFLQHLSTSVAASNQTPDQTMISSSKNPRVLTAKLALAKRQIARQAVRIRNKLSTAVVHASWSMVYCPKAYYWHHRFLTRKNHSRTRMRLEEDFKLCATSFLRKWFRNSEGNRPRYECEACYEPFATTADLIKHSHGASATGAACVASKSRARLEWMAVESDVGSLHRRQRYQESVWKQVMSRIFPRKQLPRLEAIVNNPLDVTKPILYRVQVCDSKRHSHLNFGGFKLTKRIAQRLQRQTDRASIQQLIDLAFGIVGSATRAELNTTKLPCELVGYVFQTLGGLDLDEGESISECSNKSSLMLLRTALYQFVTWNMLCECPSHTRSRAVTDGRSDVSNDDIIDVNQLLSLVDGKHHRSMKELIANSSKIMLDRCYHWFGKWRQRSAERQIAYHPGITHDNPSSGVDIGPMPMYRGPMSAFKRVGHHMGHGSAAAASPSTVVPITT